MYFAPPKAYDMVMTVPFGKVITVGKIREKFAKIRKSCGCGFYRADNGGIIPRIGERLKPAAGLFRNTPAERKNRNACLGRKVTPCFKRAGQM